MLKKTSFYICTLICGILLASSSFIFKAMLSKPLEGVLIGIGAGLFGMSISNLITKSIEKKNPEVMKQNEIELKDERNTMIRNKAKAHAGDIIQWFIIGIAYLLILSDASLWLTLAATMVYLLYHILGIYFMGKYQKEM